MHEGFHECVIFCAYHCNWHPCFSTDKISTYITKLHHFAKPANYIHHKYDLTYSRVHGKWSMCHQYKSHVCYVYIIPVQHKCADYVVFGLVSLHYCEKYSQMIVPLSFLSLVFMIVSLIIGAHNFLPNFFFFFWHFLFFPFNLLNIFCPNMILMFHPYLNIFYS